MLRAYCHRICLLLQLQSLDSFRPATLAEVCAVHDKRYPEALQKIVQQQQMEAQYTIVESAPTYVTSSSYEDALQVSCATVIAQISALNGVHNLSHSAAAAQVKFWQVLLLCCSL